MSAAEETLIEISYEEPYFISLPESLADGNLTLTGNGTNLGGLEPAAGGNEENLGDLEPAAGPGTEAAGEADEEDTACANAFLDEEWALEPEQRRCDTTRQNPAE